MNLRTSLSIKYESYMKQGHAAFAVTLSTYIKSESFALSGRMDDFWESHFLHRVRRSLPYRLKNQFDHDFVVEKSPDDHFHYHGLLVFTDQAATRFWQKDALNRQIKRDLDSFRHAGNYRPFCVNKFLIEPIRAGQVDAWIRYITKDNQITAPALH